MLASYQLAYNGIKVRISGSKAEALELGARRRRGLSGAGREAGQHPRRAARRRACVWGGSPAFAGEHIKIADIDTGIDYTHADFGGSGNPLDYDDRAGLGHASGEPGVVRSRAPRGSRAASTSSATTTTPIRRRRAYQPVPHPDPNPLDCNGHGTHTAGTAAGSGVLANGHTYTGPYNATTVSGNSWIVGPGVAPKADIYAVRVFGCEGSTDVVVDAIEWAVANNMDVINMSLGSPFGSPDTPDAVASTNAARDGVIVIASSGNNGGNAYITGSPASSAGALSVAASDPTQAFPGANLTLTKADKTSGGSLTAIVANGFSPLPPGPFNLRVIYSAPNVISLGCSVAADVADGPIAANTFIVVARGTCARVAKAIFGQQAGAAGVIMVNNSAAFPPFEGPITSDPDPPGPPLFGGFDYNVTIPFLGVPGGSESVRLARGRAAQGRRRRHGLLSGCVAHEPGLPRARELQLVGAGDR